MYSQIRFNPKNVFKKSRRFCVNKMMCLFLQILFYSPESLLLSGFLAWELFSTDRINMLTLRWQQVFCINQRQTEVCVWRLIWRDLAEENFFGNSGRAEKPSGWRGEELIMSQTLKSVLEEEEAVFRVGGVRGGRWVTKLGVSLVALWLADPGKSNFGCMIDNDIITRAHMERSQSIDEKLCKTNVN